MKYQSPSRKNVQNQCNINIKRFHYELLALVGPLGCNRCFCLSRKQKKRFNINVNKLGKAAVVAADTSSTELAFGFCEAEAGMRAPENGTLRMGQNGFLKQRILNLSIFCVEIQVIGRLTMDPQCCELNALLALHLVVSWDAIRMVHAQLPSRGPIHAVAAQGHVGETAAGDVLAH